MSKKCPEKPKKYDLIIAIAEKANITARDGSWRQKVGFVRKFVGEGVGGLGGFDLF